MPEPNKKIEDLLKRHVAQRKAESDADFELHPATRNLLQGEVARTFSKSKDSKSKSLLFALWPRLAIIGGFTALLVATVMVLNQPGLQRLKVAQNKSTGSVSAPQESDLSGQAEPASDIPAEKSFLTKREVPASSAASAGQTAIADNETRSETRPPELAAAPAQRKLELTEKKVFSQNVSSNSILPPAIEPAVGGAVAATSPAANAHGLASRSQFDAGVEPQNRARFVQQDLRSKYRRNFLSPPPPKILQSFELVQNGNEIRLLDIDGSVYEGEVTPAGQKEVAEEKTKDKSAKYTTEENSTFTFRVSGANQQLHQIVTFTGELANTSEMPEKTNTSSSANASGNLIFGKVSIGGTNEFEIRAVEK